MTSTPIDLDLDLVKSLLPLPGDEWRAETWCGQVVVTWGKHGMTTIDFKLRGYRSGMSITGRLIETDCPVAYTGQGWKRRLIKDAIAWLQEVCK